MSSDIAVASSPTGAALTPLDVPGRLRGAAEAVASAGLDALLVAGRSNVRYLTGFSGSAGFVVLAGASVVLVTDGRYATQAAQELASAGVAAEVEVSPAVGQGGVARAVAQRCRVRRLGVEAEHVSWAKARAMTEEWFGGIEVVATAGIVETLRLRKEPGEIERIARAAAAADAAFARSLPLLEERPTEREVAAFLEAEISLGSSGPSFETIVAAGSAGAMPHHRPGDRRIEPGWPVVVDFGARVDGYCSDTTRTVWVGDLVDPQLRRAVEVVAESQAAGVAAVAAGVAASHVDEVCRAVIARAGWAEHFVHGTGHGIGLDVHEAPAVASTSLDTLGAGHVVTVEPGVYLPGLGGVRIEDTVAVTDGGCLPLTNSPKDRC